MPKKKKKDRHKKKSKGRTKMPRATLNREPETHTLKSAPPDGFVKLRRMSYGERLHRQDMAMAMSMEQDAKNKSAKVDISATQTAVTMYEMAMTVVDHNLEDESGRKLNFQNEIDVKSLDPRVGEEISTLVDKMHDWETDLPNYEPKFTASSTDSPPADAQEVTGKVLTSATSVS